MENYLQTQAIDNAFAVNPTELAQKRLQMADSFRTLLIDNYSMAIDAKILSEKTLITIDFIDKLQQIAAKKKLISSKKIKRMITKLNHQEEYIETSYKRFDDCKTDISHILS